MALEGFLFAQANLDNKNNLQNIKKTDPLKP